MIEIRAVAFNETQFYGTDVREFAEVFDIHIYSQAEKVRSFGADFYELPWLFTRLRFREGVSDEEKANFDFDLTIPSEYRYLSVAVTERLPFVSCGTFLDINDALEHLRVHRPEIP